LELRQYQADIIEQLRQSLRDRKKRPLFVLPTGAGKTPVLCQIIENLVSNGKQVLFLVHRRRLIEQIKGMLKDDFGLDAGIIMAGVSSNLESKIQLASIATYERRLNLDTLMYNRYFVDADVVLIDEAHRSVSQGFKEILELYSDKIIIGCTATPIRGDGRGLGEVYNNLIVGPDIGQLTNQGYLCPARYFVPTTINLDGVKVAMGDYQIKALEKKINKKKLIGDIVENWLRIAENRKTIVFCVNVRHSIAVCDAFARAGIKSAHLDAHSSDDEREDILQKVEKGEIRVLANVGLYTEGLDVPDISCIVLARPTKSMGLYRQMAGRGLRPGKEDLIIIDHGNVIQEHGLLEDEIIWSLDGRERAWKKRKHISKKRMVQCRVCGLVFEGTSICPDCGSPVKAFGKPIESIDADLQELKNKRKTNKDLSWADKRKFAGALLWYEKKKGWNPGRKAHLYRLVFGVWPNDPRVKYVSPIEPGDDKISKLVKYALIKSAKSYKKEIAT